MGEFLRKYWLEVSLSVALHAALIGVLVGWAQLPSMQSPPPAAATNVAIQATVVDEQAVQKEMERLAAEDQAKAREQAKAEAAAEQARKDRAAEEARLAKLEEQRKQQAEQLAQERKAAEEARKQREAEQQRAAALAKQREEEEARRKAEEEAKRKAEEERKRQEEAQRKAEAERKRKEEEARRKAEAERKRQEAQARAQLNAELAAEEQRRQAVESGLLDQYVTLIKQKVERNWNRPASAGSDLRCEVTVRQIPGGDVVSVQIGQCNGDDAVVRSIEAAVRRASPLPEPPDPSLFERTLRFIFAPDD